jgi:hypothetical protein
MDQLDKQSSFAAKRAPDAVADAADAPAAKRRKGVAPSVTHAGSVAVRAPSGVAADNISSPALSSVAQRCDQDSLSVVFSFCKYLSEVVAAARTCRSWRAVANLRRSSRRAKVTLIRAAFLQMLQSESPLRVHLSTLTLEYHPTSVQDLLQLFARCPHLEQLAVWVDGASVAALTKSVSGAAAFASQAWPSSLHSLVLEPFGTTLIGMQPLVDALPSSVAGLQSLTVMPWDGVIDMDFAPLLRLPQLTRLSITRTLRRSQLAVVKQLRSLTELVVDAFGRWGGTRSLLPQLLDGPHQLQRLQKINVQHVNLDTTDTQALMTLPSLTELEPMGIDPACFPLLRSFSRLHKLTLTPHPPMDVTAVDGLLSSLREMPNLSSLAVGPDNHQNSPATWRKLLDGLDAAAPQLRELTFSLCTLPSLTQLNAGAQLRVLYLQSCGFEGAQDSTTDEFLQWVRSMRHLERLRVTYSLLLTIGQRQQLTLPSSLIPSLQHFHCSV